MHSKSNVLDITLFFKRVEMSVSDTREAYGSWTPGHHAGIGKELNSSVGVVSSDGC